MNSRKHINKQSLSDKVLLSLYEHLISAANVHKWNVDKFSK